MGTLKCFNKIKRNDSTNEDNFFSIVNQGPITFIK